MPEGGGPKEMPVIQARVYDEIVDFLAAGRSSAEVAAFVPPEEAKSRVFELVEKEKTSGLTAEETPELEPYLQIEHLMRLSKARARKLLQNE